MPSKRARPPLLSAGAAVLLVVLVQRLGAAPFLRGARSVDGRAVAVAVLAGAVATVACAWRWQQVARRLGAELALPSAIAAYYRSQLLNTVLPGGVLGDVHRGVRHGQRAGSVGTALRAVALERLAGQAVQVALVLLVLVVLPSPVRGLLPVVLTVLAGAVGAVLLLHRRAGAGDGAPWARWVRAAEADVRSALLARAAWPGVVLSSTVVVTAHTCTFVVAATAAGTAAPLDRLVPLALLNLLAMSVPVSLAGWGPREGAAAWSFAAAGHGAAQGVAVGTAYGVLVATATLPGVVVLVGSWLRGSAAVPERAADRCAPQLLDSARG